MIIFRSTDLGATQIHDDEGLVLTFQRQNNNLIKNAAGENTRTNKSDDWLCAVDDSTEQGKEIIARAKKHPKYKTEFEIIDQLPVSGNRASKVKK